MYYRFSSIVFFICFVTRYGLAISGNSSIWSITDPDQETSFSTNSNAIAQRLLHFKAEKTYPLPQSPKAPKYSGHFSKAYGPPPISGPKAKGYGPPPITGPKSKGYGPPPISGPKAKGYSPPTITGPKSKGYGPPPALSPACNFVAERPYFYLESPGYPGYYPAFANCYYTVKRAAANICSLELELRDFYLEVSPQCSNDWFQIGPKRYCGLQTNQRILVPFGHHRELVFHFYSNGFQQFKGFHIIGRQIPCGNQPVNPPPPIYPPPIIPPPPVYPPPINPPPVNPPPPVYPPPVIPPPPVYPPPIIPPVTPPPIYPPPTYTPRPPTFTPPTITPPTSTEAPPNLPCDFDFRQPQGQFQSPNYPGNYGSNLNCQYRFQPQEGFCTLQLTFEDFQVEDSLGCTKDAFLIGSSKYCNVLLAGQTLRIAFPSGASVKTQFVSDYEGSGRGFKARYRLLPCSLTPTTPPPFTTPVGVTCDRSFSEPEAFITSVNYPSAYLKNLECIYSIEKYNPLVNELEVYFVSFEIQDSFQCQADFLEIDGKRYCGVQTGTTVRVPFINSVMELRFRSDFLIELGGFNIRVRQLIEDSTTDQPTTPPNIGCGTQIFNETSFLITSPQFPAPYRSGQQCQYTVLRKSEDVCELQLNFILFSLPQTGNCLGDYLEVDGVRYCGELSNQIKKIFFLDPQLTLTFNADSIDEQIAGFSIQAVQLTECYPYPTDIPPGFRLEEAPPCDIRVTKAAGSITSSDVKFSDKEKDNEQCGYSFTRQPGSCGVELRFNEFYVTPTTNCTANYLEIENRRFCGQQLNNMKVDVGFSIHSSEVTLPFRISPETKFLWNLTYSPISCETLRQQCSSSIWTQSGGFKYTNQKRAFSEAANCDFVIRRWSRRMCRVEIQLTNFLLAGNSNCSDNYLEIGGQKLCGNLSGRSLSLEFPESEEFLRFPLQHTADSPFVDLEININQINCR